MTAALNIHESNDRSGITLNSESSSRINIINSKSNLVGVNTSSGLITPPERLIPKPTITTAELRVSRSLDPENTQTLNVRTNRGGIATLIVKRRNNKLSNEPRTFYDINNTVIRAESERGYFEPATVQQQQQQPQQLPLKSSSQISNNGGSWSVISPVNQNYNYNNKRNIEPLASIYGTNDKNSMDAINSFIRHVENTEKKPRKNFAERSIKNDRRPVHIPVSSMQVNTVEQIKVPPPVFINSDAVYVKDNKNNKRSRSLLEIGDDGIPLIHGIRVPDDESDKKHTWRNARVINGELVPYEKGYVPPPVETRQADYGQLVFAKNKTDQSRSIGPYTTADNFSAIEQPKSIGPFSVEDNLNSDSDIGNGNGNSKRFSEYSNSRRFLPAQSGIGPFSIADNSKTSNAKLIEYIRKINDHESRRDYFAGRASKVVFNKQPMIQRRMLQNTPNIIYPSSSMYSLSSESQNSNFDANGVRSPVLQYAHPEFGVEAAESVPLTNDQQHSHPKPKPSKIVYYSKNVYNDHSPYENEPSSASKDFYDNTNTKVASNSNNRNRQYMYQDDMNKPLKNLATYPYNYGFIRRVKAESPYWMQLTEQMRDSFQNGFSAVQEMTRPVIDPIVEAGQKISMNLGFSHREPTDNNYNTNAQKKVGLVMAPASGSIILPALGLVAGGAAFGLGAVAVGRLFDVAQIKRSNDNSILELEMEHKRALDAIHNNTHIPTSDPSIDNLYFVMEEPNSNEQKKRYRRSVNYYTLDGNRGTNANPLLRFDQETVGYYGNSGNQAVNNGGVYKSDEQQSDIIEIYDYKNNDQDDSNSEAVSSNNFFNIISIPETQNHILLRADSGRLRTGAEVKHHISERSIGIAADDSLGSILQDVEQDIPKSSKIGFEQRIKNTDWSNTPCAKKVFCEVMLEQNSDDVVVMEKKMYTLLGM